MKQAINRFVVFDLVSDLYPFDNEKVINVKKIDEIYAELQDMPFLENAISKDDVLKIVDDILRLPDVENLTPIDVLGAVKGLVLAL